MQVDFELPTFVNEGVQARFCCPEDIRHHAEALDELETCHEKIQCKGAQCWEDAVSCIKSVAVEVGKECTRKCIWELWATASLPPHAKTLR